MAVGIKQVPFVQLIAYPIAGGTNNFPRAAAIGDTVANLGRPAGGSADPQTPLGERGNRVAYTSGLRYWDLADPQTGTRTAGYTLDPTLQPMHSIMTGAEEPDDDYEVATFVGVKGDYWTTVTPGYAPHTEAIKWYNSAAPSGDPEQQFVARSSVPMGDAQSFAFQLHTFGMVDDDSYWCLQWGGGYGLYLAANEPAVLVRGNSRKLETLRTLDVPPETFFAGEPVWVYVHYMGGRLVVEIAKGKAKHQTVYSNMRADINPNDQTGTMTTLEMKQVQTAPGPLVVYGQGVPFTLRVHELTYPATGEFQRDYQLLRETQDDAPDVAVAFGTNPKGTRTQNRPGAALEDGASITAAQSAAGGGHNYVCTLTRAQGPSTGVLGSGQHTPFVHGVGLRYTSTWASTRPDGMLLTPALLDLTVDIADPGLAPGTTVTAMLRRDLLPDCPSIDDAGIEGAAVGSNWTDFLAKYHQCKLVLGWYSDDGGVLTVEDDWCVLDGYVWSLDHRLPGYGENVVQVEFRDPIVRLQKPAGVIDSRFGPADMILAKKVADGDPPHLYGREVVEYILGVVLGAAWAALLQTSASLDGSSYHYDMLTYKNLTGPPFGSGFFWPPPWGQSAMDWINTIAETDYAVFFFRPNPLDPTGPPQPNYAYYWDVVAHGAAIELNDAVVDPEDVDLLIQEAGSRQRPEHDYNVVAVWGHIPQDQGNYRDLLPALPQISGMAWIGDSGLDEQSPYKTWERTLVKEGTQFWRSGVARVVAHNLARLLTGVDPRSVPITLARGDAQFWWGDKVRLADSVIPGNEMRDTDFLAPADVFRVMRVRHRVVMKDKSWTTTLSGAPEADVS